MTMESTRGPDARYLTWWPGVVHTTPSGGAVRPSLSLLPAAQHRPSLSREGNGTSMCSNDF